MEKPDKSAEPSMEEILASIRKIIAEDPAGQDDSRSADQLAADPLAEQRSDGSEMAPPGADLSDILDEPASDSATEQLTTFATRSRPEPNVAPLNQERQRPGQLLPGLADDASPVAGPPVKPIGPTAAAVDLAVPDDQQESPLVARLKGLSTGLTSGQPSPVMPESEKPGIPSAPGASGDADGVAAKKTEPEPGGADLAKAPETSDATPAAEKPADGGPSQGKAAAGDAKGPAPKLPEGEQPSNRDAKSDSLSDRDSASPSEPSPAIAPSGAVAASLTALTGTAANTPPVAEKDTKASAPADKKAGAPSIDPQQSSSQAPSAASGTPLEEALAELLRPTVEKWLAANVPALIAEAVHKKMDESD